MAGAKQQCCCSIHNLLWGFVYSNIFLSKPGFTAPSIWASIASLQDQPTGANLYFPHASMRLDLDLVHHFSSLDRWLEGCLINTWKIFLKDIFSKIHNSKPELPNINTHTITVAEPTSLSRWLSLTTTRWPWDSMDDRDILFVLPNHI